MKKVKALCLGVSLVLGLAYTPGLGAVTAHAASGTTYTVNSSQGNSGLKNALSKAKSGDTVQIDGAIKSVEV